MVVWPGRASSYGARARLHKPAACLLTVAYQGVRTVGRCCGKYTSVCVCVCVSHKLTAKLLKFYATLLWHRPLQLAACTTCHLPLAAWQLPLATCHLPHATCNSTLTLSWNFSLAKRRNEKRETREGLSPINWQSMWAAHYIRIDLLFHLQAATPPLPYSFDHSFPSFQPAAGQARPSMASSMSTFMSIAVIVK